MNRPGQPPSAESGGDPRRKSERGHLMAGLMAAVAIMLIFSGLAFQEWSEVLRRDSEAEMIFRAQDMVRAIQRYRLDHGGQAPVKMEDLMEPGPKGQYYARRLWKDPLVPDGKWSLLYVGPGGQLVDPTAQAGLPGLPGQGDQQQVGIGGLANRNNRPLGPRSQSRAGRQRDDGGFGNSSGSGSGTESAFAGGEQTGLPIAGLKSLADDAPFRHYKGLTEYSQWLFSYFDLENQQQQPGQNPGGQQPIGGSPGIGGKGKGKGAGGFPGGSKGKGKGAGGFSGGS